MLTCALTLHSDLNHHILFQWEFLTKSPPEVFVCLGTDQQGFVWLSESDKNHTKNWGLYTLLARMAILDHVTTGSWALWWTGVQTYQSDVSGLLQRHASVDLFLTKRPGLILAKWFLKDRFAQHDTGVCYNSNPWPLRQNIF